MFNDRFEILAEVGKGPTGTVFQAREKTTGSVLAIKHVPAQDDNEFVIQRLSAEWEKVQALSHPNVVSTFELNQDADGSHFIVSNFVDGISAQQALVRNGKLSVREALVVVNGVVAGVQAAHNRGLLHLNLKPQNVLISGSGLQAQANVSDFALWRSAADPGQIDPLLAFYQSPEQRRNSELSFSCDIYSIGKLLYVLVSGEASGRISPEAVPSNDELQQVIYRCIRTSPEDRYANMQDVLEALGNIDAGTIAEGALPSLDHQESRLPKLEAGAAPAAAPVDETPSQVRVAHGKIRVSSELESMLAAARRHLSEKRLATSRELLDELQQKAAEYTRLEGPEWLQQNADDIDNLEAALEQREAEVRSLVENAAAALEEKKFEDCLLYCSAAREVCSEHLDVDKYEERAKQQIANSNVFWEEAHRALKLGYYDKADVACMKLLDIRPDHEDALEMRRRIHARRRRKRMFKASMILILILALVAVPGVLFGLWKYQRRQAVDKFTRLVENQDAQAAEKAAASILKYHKPALDFLEARQRAKERLAEMKELQEMIDPAFAAERQETAGKWKDAQEQSQEALAAYKIGRHDVAEDSASAAIERYKEVRLRMMVLTDILPAMKEQKWQLAHDKLQEASELVPDSKIVQGLLNEVRQFLIPEITIRTTVNDTEVKGAYIYLDGKRQNQRTPHPVLLKIGKPYELRVVMPPRGEQYYVPHEQRIRLDKNEAKTLNVQLKTVVGPAPNKEWIVPDLELKFAPIQPGTFEMGSETGEADERPIRRIMISRAFWCGAYEITQQQYERVMGSQPSLGTKDPSYPVNNVSWFEAHEFCRRLTKRETQEHRLPEGYIYRLPTEAEWEYCCRANSPLDPDLDQSAWYEKNAGSSGFQAVGLKLPNPWGLHDMLGNVAEWCLDWYSATAYMRRQAKDPFGPDRGSYKVARGGSRVSSADQCRCADRLKLAPKSKNANLGFRIVLAPRQ